MFYRAPTEQQTARMRRARPVIALAGGSLAIGAIVGASQASWASRDLAARFVSAWSRGDYAEMYSEVDARTRHSLSERHFAAAYESALVTATAVRQRVAGRARSAGDAGGAPPRVATRRSRGPELPFSA